MEHRKNKLTIVGYCAVCMSKKNFFLFCITSLFFVFVFTVPALSAPSVDNIGQQLDQAVDKTGVTKSNIPTVAGAVIKTLLSLVSLFFLVLTVYAGITWLTARGNDEMVGKARNTLAASVIGLIIAVGAYALVLLITGRFLGSS